MDEVDVAVVVLQALAMLAAFGAIWYAQETIFETRALRQEERLARLLSLIAEVGEHGTRAARGQAGDNVLDVARLRLRAELSASGTPLPQSAALLDLQWPSYGRDTDATEREAEAIAAVDAAMGEVADERVRLRGQGSTALDR